MLAIRIHETGGPELLRVDDVPVPEPGPGELRFRVEAAGVNFIDTYQRSGLYPLALPAALGQEGAGVVSAVGPGVMNFSVGERVATAKASGAYAVETLAPVAQVVKVPAAIDARTAAAVLLQGLTAHYLAGDTFPLKAGDTALIHAGAGGVGLLLIQMARRRGARTSGGAHHHHVGDWHAEQARQEAAGGRAAHCTVDRDGAATWRSGRGGVHQVGCARMGAAVSAPSAQAP